MRRALVDFIGWYVLADYSSFDLQELVDNLPEDIELAASYFCNRLELGNWFYEAMTLNEVDISAELINIGARKELEEKEAASVSFEIEKEYRRSQGWVM